ncbi:MAG: hypothetical protein CVT59_06505 [Actinobacteria bacterium HGW-Actinobacteria-1]|jgi:hypothetical protein|nr:MAG: hypothetical protein CVT59_06505 [Actinobacteria bacterium HGW-Actinobacteria-1]
MLRRKCAVLVIVMLASALLLPTPALAERTLALSTGTFDFNVAAGQTAKGSVLVMNSGDEPLEVLVYAGNQVVDADGTVRFIVPTPGGGQTLDNPSSWMRLDLGESVKSAGNVPFIELAAGQRSPVEFEFTVPDGVPPGDYQIMLFFEMSMPPKTQDQAQATVSGRLASRIHIRVEGEVVQRLEIKPFYVRGFVLGSTIPYTLMLQNSGNVDSVASAKVTVSSTSGREVMSSSLLSSTTVYARSNTETSGVLAPTGTLFGKYTVKVDVEYPREGTSTVPPEILSETRTVWAIPLWFAIGVVVVVGGLAIWASWRQAVKAAERKANARRATRRTRRTDLSETNGDPASDQSSDTE